MDKWNPEQKHWMAMVLAEAKKAAEKGEVPIACAIVKDNELLALRHNEKETSQSVLAHAELLALADANQSLHSWRLEDCDLYVSLEPCPMCASAIQQARIRHVYFATTEPKMGALVSRESLLDRPYLNHRVTYTMGPFTEEASALLKDFFRQRRLRNKKLNQALGGRAGRKAFMQEKGPDFKSGPSEGVFR